MFIGIVHFLRISSKYACARGFIDFIVTRSYFPLVSNRNVGSNPLIEPIFIDIGIISLYIESKSILCIGMMAKLCKNVFCFTFFLFVDLFSYDLYQSIWNELDIIVVILIYIKG